MPLAKRSVCSASMGRPKIATFSRRELPTLRTWSPRARRRGCYVLMGWMASRSGFGVPSRRQAAIPFQMISDFAALFSFATLRSTTAVLHSTLSIPAEIVNGGVKILSGGGLKILWERPTHGWLKGLRSHWRRFELIFHSEAAAFDHDGFSVVKEAVQNGRGDGAVVVENRGPLFKGFVGGQDDGAAFISLADSLEEQIGAVLVDG